ncbi:IS30 family transposase [Peribacillus huizhouensis]|uniref:IS30 family transposase n=1 Tax=Peribacillus huizhouensis TaxID=1501239 RepID=A0ABR6CIG0_9BACI|nr:IS30 family transposase [Peribacillus huizhouensis]
MAGVEGKTLLTRSAKYQLIEQSIRQHQLKTSVSFLCGLAGVSRSGYYAWLKAVSIRQRKDEEDQKDIKLIQYIFNQKKQKVGALQIKMILENDYFVVMNHKKIRRLIRTLQLIAKVRMAKAAQEHRTCPNLLNREFNQDEPVNVINGYH